MSAPRAEPAEAAARFAALGDTCRLALLARLGAGEPRSIGELAAGLPVSRQAVTKHLRILEAADLVTSRREGRRALFALQPNGLRSARDYLDRASRQWDDALARLAAFVEQD